MSTYSRPIGISIAIFVAILPFQNCTENLKGAPDQMNSASNASVAPAPLPSPNPIAPPPAISMAKVILTSGSTWTVPAGVTRLESVEVWGAGGGSMTDADGASYGAGGGGGYSKITSFSVSPGSTISFSVGTPGISSDTGRPTSGGDTWFATPATLLAKGGDAGGIVKTDFSGGKGGQAAAGVGTTRFSGGDGGAANGLGGGGGGAAASPIGNGGNGAESLSTGPGGQGGTSPGAGSGGSGSASDVAPVDAAAARSNELGGGGGGGGGGQTTGQNAPPGNPAGGGGAGGFPGGGAGSTGAIAGNGFGVGRISGNGGGGQIIIQYVP